MPGPARSMKNLNYEVRLSMLVFGTFFRVRFSLYGRRICVEYLRRQGGWRLTGSGTGELTGTSGLANERLTVAR